MGLKPGTFRITSWNKQLPLKLSKPRYFIIITQNRWMYYASRHTHKPLLIVRIPRNRLMCLHSWSPDGGSFGQGADSGSLGQWGLTGENKPRGNNLMSYHLPWCQVLCRLLTECQDHEVPSCLMLPLTQFRLSILPYSPLCDVSEPLKSWNKPSSFMLVLLGSLSPSWKSNYCRHTSCVIVEGL